MSDHRFNNTFDMKGATPKGATPKYASTAESTPHPRYPVVSSGGASPASSGRRSPVKWLLALCAVLAVLIYTVTQDRADTAAVTTSASGITQTASSAVRTTAAPQTATYVYETTAVRDSSCDVVYESGDTIFTVTVAYSNNLDYCKTCIGRLRDAGYNAYIYKASSRDGYSLLIGAWSSKDYAQTYANYLHTQPAIRGVEMNNAYVLCKTCLSSSDRARYSNTWY